MLKSQDLFVGAAVRHVGAPQWLLNHLDEEFALIPTVNRFPLALEGDVMIVLALSHLKNCAYVLLSCCKHHYYERSEGIRFGWIHVSGKEKL